MITLLNFRWFSLILAWYDFWVGAYFDVEHRTLYICLIPCVVLRFRFPGRIDEASHRQDRYEPVIKKEFGISHINKTHRLVTLDSTGDAIRDFIRYGTLHPQGGDRYILYVDARYDFDDVVAYINGSLWQPIGLKNGDNSAESII